MSKWAWLHSKKIVVCETLDSLVLAHRLCFAVDLICGVYPDLTRMALPFQSLEHLGFVLTEAASDLSSSLTDESEDRTVTSQHVLYPGSV